MYTVDIENCRFLEFRNQDGSYIQSFYLPDISALFIYNQKVKEDTFSFDLIIRGVSYSISDITSSTEQAKEILSAWKLSR